MDVNNNGKEFRRSSIPEENIIEAEIISETGDRQPEPTRPGGQRALWVDLLAIVGVFIVAQIVGAMFGSIIMKTAEATQAFATFVSQVITMVIAIGFALWLKYKRGLTRPLLSFSLKKSNPVLILWGLLLVFATSVVIEPILELFPASNLDQLSKAIGTGGWAMLTVIILGPITEEILFRGVIQDAAEREYGVWKSILLTAAVFGIVHWIPQQVINAFFIGLILSYIFYKTRSLVPVIIIHMVNNALAFITMTTYKGEAMTLRQLISSDLWYAVVYGLSFVLFALACFNVWYQLNRKQKNIED